MLAPVHMEDQLDTFCSETSAMTPEQCRQYQHSRLLALPAELRLRIFQFCFEIEPLASAKPMLLRYHSLIDTPIEPRTRIIDVLPLVTLCRQLKEEVIEAFYSTGAHMLKVEWAEYFSQTKQLYLPPRHVRGFIRRIVFSNVTENFWHSAIGHGQSLAPLQRLKQLGFEHLKLVEIVIVKSTADIINVCFEEPQDRKSKVERLHETVQAFRGLRLYADRVAILGLDRQPNFRKVLEDAITLYR